MRRRKIPLLGHVFLGFLLMQGCLLPLMADEAVSASDMQFPSAQDVLGHVWNEFLSAMGTGNDWAVRSQCTEGGFQSLLSQMDAQKPHAVQWRWWSRRGFKGGAIRWQSITSIMAYGKLGPEKKETTINFVLTPKGWKLDQSSPGE